MPMLTRNRTYTLFLTVLGLCLIIGISFWGYYDTLDDFFIMDDFSMIKGHSSFGQFLKHWYTPVGGNAYRPLIDLTFLWDFTWWKWNPVGWHLTNLLFHLLNVLLVYLLAAQILENRVAALLAGLIFGLHPGNSEAVIWISARMDVVGTSCILLSLLLFLASHTVYHTSPRHQGKRRLTSSLSLFFFACALLIKETAVVVPALLVACDLIFITPFPRFRHEIWNTVKRHIPYMLVFLGYFSIRALIVSQAHDYGSQTRGLLGGYDVNIIGSFLFGNLEWYFKNLTRPFWEELFSASLVINLLVIAWVAICCLIFSKVSRFAMLWVLIALLPVSFLRIHRGVYLPSIGFCLFMGLLLTFRPEQESRSSSWRHSRLFRRGLQLVQILLIAFLCLRYAAARQEANEWWGDVAEINETVPLMMHTLYPSFPDDAILCLDNVPLVFNQRINDAFTFRYGDTNLSGIYLQPFETCIAEQKDEPLSNLYFFYYDHTSKSLNDVTVEIREPFQIDQSVHVTRLFRRPEHLLSATSPHLHVELEAHPPGDRLVLVTSLANAIAVPQGTLVARGQIQAADGTMEPFELVAGEDTAEWAILFPGVQEAVQHDMPSPYRRWTVRQSEKTYAIAQNYIKTVRFQIPLAPVSVSLDLLDSPDIPPNVNLDVNRVIVYSDRIK